MITIDEFLPAGLAVDLVKIDVEGHEPFVIRGMQKTIRRSPNIRIFIEFVEAFLSHTVSADQFAAEIEGLGLRICRVLPRSALELIERGQPPRGAISACSPGRQKRISRMRSVPRSICRLAWQGTSGGWKRRWDRYRRALYRS